MGAVMREFARTLLRNYEDFVTRFSAATAALHDSRRDSRAFGESLDGAVAALLRELGGPCPFCAVCVGRARFGVAACVP